MGLKHCFKLSHRLALYIPTRDSKGRSLGRLSQKVRDESLRWLSRECGGATATKALGSWLSGSGLLIKEEVTLIFAFRKSLDVKFAGRLLEYAESIKARCRQESLAVEVDGELYLI